jgi:ribosome-binding protein aMBF1 (putative translation factor)
MMAEREKRKESKPKPKDTPPRAKHAQDHPWATLSRAECARLLREARESRGISVKDAAALTGLHHQSIRDFESGHRQPTYQALHRLVTALGYDLPRLFPSPRKADRKPSREARDSA